MIKPLSVTPMENYMLKIEFNNGETRLFNLKPYFSVPYYASLQDKNLFKTVHIGDMTVEWADGKDIAPHELYETSTPLQ